MTILTPQPGPWRGAIIDAKPGDTIHLADGVYSYLNLYGPTYNKVFPGVTIELSAGTVLSGVAIQGCGGYHFKGPGLVLKPATHDAAMELLAAHDIDIDGLRFAENPNAAPDAVKLTHGVGLTVTNTLNVSVRNCDFGWLGIGISHRKADGLTVTDCSFHDISTDGMHGASSRVTVRRNSFTDFYAAVDPSGTRTHFDPVQFWTTNVTTPLTDIVIADNLILRGKGDTMSQLQMGDEADRGQGAKWTQIKVGYQRVEIAGNLFAGGGNFQIEGAVDAYVHDNCFAGTEADTHMMPDGVTVSGFQPKVVLAHCIGGRVENNAGLAASTFYQPISPGVITGDLVDRALRGPAGDYSRAMLWWAGRRAARQA